MRPIAGIAHRGRSPQFARTVLRVERRLTTWPLSVGLGRVLGVLGLFAACIQLLTWPLVVVPSLATLHAVLLCATALGSVALVVTPSSTIDG